MPNTLNQHPEFERFFRKANLGLYSPPLQDADMTDVSIRRITIAALQLMAAAGLLQFESVQQLRFQVEMAVADIERNRKVQA